MTSYSIRTSFDVPREIGVVKKLRVLVVEDDGVVAMLVEDMLIELGHEVTAVVSRIEEALQLAKTGSFDFAILDLNLGGKPSNAVAELLESRDIPFVIATGYGEQGRDPKFAKAPILSKPFAVDDLARAVSDLRGCGR